MIMSDLEDRVYSWLLKKSRNNSSGNVRAGASMVGLCQDVINDPIEVRKSLDNLRRNGKVEYSATPNGEPVSAYIRVVQPVVNVPEHEAMWASALALSGINGSDVSALESLASVTQGFSDIQMTAIINGLKRLRDEQQALFGQPLFYVSAKYLLGSSKILSVFNNRALKSFGIEIDRFPDRPPYIVVGGNGQNPEAVILVENPISFETAIQSNAGMRCVFVCTFGFGLSNVGSEFGYQLAGAIETGNAIILNRTGSQFNSLDNLMLHPRVQFWGDLDPAGIQIYLRLKQRLPQLEFSAMYRPMIAMLDIPMCSHPYVTATGKAGQIDMKVNCSDTEDVAKGLLKRCSIRGVDQECVSPNDILMLAGGQL
jgi:hypothetical protein